MTIQREQSLQVQALLSAVVFIMGALLMATNTGLKSDIGGVMLGAGAAWYLLSSFRAFG